MWLTNQILREVLYKKNSVCCLCFKVTGEDALCLYDEIYLDDLDISLEFSNIIDSVFENKISAIEFLSHSLCQECAKSAISAYKFIERCTVINNTMMNTICNLTEITEKTIATGKGMYIVADPRNFESKIFCDPRKTDTSVTILLKRFHTFLKPKKPKQEKGNKENGTPPCFKTQCDSCGVVLRSSYLWRHRKICKPKNDIKEESEDTNNINSGMDISECNNSDSEAKVFDDESDLWEAQMREKKLKQQLYKKNLEEVSCKHCGASIKNKYAIIKHMLYHCKGITQYEREIIKNRHEERVENRKALKKQIEMIKAQGGDVKSYKQLLQKKKCEFCGISCRNKYNLKKHLLGFCKALNETNRTEAFVTDLLKINSYKHHTGSLKEQLKSARKRNVVKPKSKKSKLQNVTFTCSYCDQSFPSKSILTGHIYKECKNTPSELKYSVCSQCGKQYLTKYLKVHEKTHSICFTCDKCSKVFKSRRSYKKHLRMPDCVENPYEVPEPEKKYNCHVCGKLFASQKSMNGHYVQMHTDSGFKCMFCEKKFSHKHGLKLHMVVHTKEKNFDCQLCGGKFVSKASLLYHTRTHTGEKPYKCQFCDSRFLSASRRNLHTRIHHLPPKLECKYCLKKFNIWAGLSKHRKRHFMPGSSLYMPQLQSQVKTKKSVYTDSEDECLSS